MDDNDNDRQSKAKRAAIPLSYAYRRDTRCVSRDEMRPISDVLYRSLSAGGHPKFNEESTS